MQIEYLFYSNTLDTKVALIRYKHMAIHQLVSESFRDRFPGPQFWLQNLKGDCSQKKTQFFWPNIFQNAQNVSLSLFLFQNLYMIFV